MTSRLEHYANGSDTAGGSAARAFAWFATQTKSYDPALWANWWRSLAPVIPGRTISMDPWPCDYQVAQGLSEVADADGSLAYCKPGVATRHWTHGRGSRPTPSRLVSRGPVDEHRAA